MIDKHTYNRDDFHLHAQHYECLFQNYYSETDILINSIYWNRNAPRLIEPDALLSNDFRIQTIADITDDKEGSIPFNLGDATIEEPVYNIDKKTLQKTPPYLSENIDLMTFGNLPNELPCDASAYFGDQLIKFVLYDLMEGNSDVIKRATILKEGKLTDRYNYLSDYAAH